MKYKQADSDQPRCSKNSKKSLQVANTSHQMKDTNTDRKMSL